MVPMPEIVIHLAVRDLEPGDLPLCAWTGSATHLAAITWALERARCGEVEYLAAFPPSGLPVHTLPGAVNAVLALDNPRMLAGAYALREFTAGHRLEVGPFVVDTWALPHFVPNAGMRLTAGGRVLAYTGDTGPSPDIAVMAREADVLLAEATFPDRVLPARDAPYLSTARQAGEHAARADAKRLVLTHLWPGTDPSVARAAAERVFFADLDIATPGMTIDLR